MEHPSDAAAHAELSALIASHAEHANSVAAQAATHTLALELSGPEDAHAVGNHGKTPAHDANGAISVASTRAFNELQLLDASSMGLSVAELEHSSDQFLASGLAPDAVGAHGESHDLSYLQPEVLHWMNQCRAANGGISASEDDVLYYFDTKYPELLRPDTCGRLFDWLHDFLTSVSTTESPRFSSEVREVALHTLYASPEATPALVVELGLKTTTTLQFWQHQQAKISAAATPSLLARQPTAKRRAPQFAHEAELVEWLLSHKHTPITNQDIVNHLEQHYPDFVKNRSSASISTWVARFLKRHLPSETGLIAGTTDASESLLTAEDVSSSLTHASSDDQQNRKRRTKRKSPNGYVLHSNEFKLNALKKLDEGKTVSEVAEELALKCPNTLVYWNSIRDKLAVADKKRFRLAGGGRRSTCNFEDELMGWVSDRDQKGELTDVTTVLQYLMENHSSFTDGKKEPTLRKWILRFFQRWRQRSIHPGAAPDDVDEMDKTNGILV